MSDLAFGFYLFVSVYVLEKPITYNLILFDTLVIEGAIICSLLVHLIINYGLEKAMALNSFEVSGCLLKAH